MTVEAKAYSEIHAHDRDGVFSGYRWELPVTPLEWEDDALCAQTDPDLFFPEVGGSVKQALAICKFCPVKRQCLELALANETTHGIWGGKSQNELKALRKARA